MPCANCFQTDLPRERLIDLALNPGQRAEIEFGGVVQSHVFAGCALLPEGLSKKRAGSVGYSKSRRKPVIP